MARAITIPRGTLIVVGLLAALVLGAIFLFVYYPTATVTVVPATYPRSVEQPIVLSSSATEPDFQRYLLPAKVVEHTVTESAEIEREGEEVTLDYARGTVRIINQQDEEQPLLPKSHLRHEATGVYFLTDEAVRVPPQGEVTVKVTAKEQGAQGDVPAGKFIIDKLPTSLQAVVYAQSDTPFSGGESLSNPLSETELEQQTEAVVAAAQSRARGELTAAAGGAQIRDDLITADVVSVTRSVEPGSRATSYTINAQVRIRGFVVDETDLLSLTLLALRALPAQDEEFVSYEPESFSLALTRADFERGEAVITGKLTGQFARKTSPSVYDPTKLAGRSEAEVREYFNQFEEIQTVDVSFSPFWLKTIPGRQGATEIVIENQE